MKAYPCRIGVGWIGVVLSVCLATKLLVLVTVANAAESERKRVIILHSFGQDFRPWGEYAKAIRIELTKQSRWPLNISDHPLVTARSNDENPEAPFAEFLDALYAKHPPDLIVCIGAPAANFIQRHRSKLFPKTPMLLTAVEQRRVRFDNLTSNDAVVAVAHDFSAVFENILRLLPDTQSAVIINGASPNEKFWRGELKRELKPFESRIKLRWFENTPFEDILKEAATLPPNTAIFWHLMNVDAAGVAYEGDAALRKLYAAANAPIFSYDDGFFGQEVVGGPMYDVEDISQKTAAVAVRILAGETAGDTKVPAAVFGTPKYDWRLLQRWNINEKLLPPGSQVFFREASVLETYRWQIFIVTAVILTQTLLITGLFYQRRRRRVAETEARVRMAELAHVNRFSTAGEMTALISHELNQPLAAILLNAETMESILQSSSPDIMDLREIASDIRRDDHRASDIIRRLRSLLKKTPFELKTIDFNEVVVEAFDLLSNLSKSRHVDIDSVKTPLPLPIKGDRVQLEQVLINLVVNAMDALSNKPARDRKIKVWTNRLPSQAEVCVLDNGPGIEASKLGEVFEPFYSTKPNGMGMGLSIARTIAEAHKGQISVETPPEGGTLFRLRLPLA